MDKYEYTGALHSVTMIAMCWRHVMLELGVIETALPAFAREVSAQVMVMGAVSRSFPERALFGHTAEKVLDALACDVLIVKPERFQSPVSVEPAPAMSRPT